MKILHPIAAAFCVLTVASPTLAEMLPNSFGVGDDVVIRRNNSGRENDGFLRIKTQSGDTENHGNDRVGLLKFDLSGLTEAITASALRLELPRGASNGFPNNTFDAGDTLYLYGVPDTGADEDFDESAINFASSAYMTGVGSVTDPRPVTDLTANGVNDDLVPLLATYTFAATSDAGDLVDFQSAALTSFLQADTNDIATFILAVSKGDVFKTAVFVSDTGTEGTPLPPTLLTNADAPVPEPAAGALMAASLACLRFGHGREARPST